MELKGDERDNFHYIEFWNFVRKSKEMNGIIVRN